MPAMLSDPLIPRLPNGRIALCAYCQRAMYFAGGFFELLRRSAAHFHNGRSRWHSGSYYARAKRRNDGPSETIRNSGEHQ